MEWNLMAVAAFVLFFIYDWNSIHLKNRVVQRFFGLGTAVLAVSAVGCLIQQKRNITWEVWQTAVFLAAFLLAVGLLVYTLFFAIPFGKQKCLYRKNVCIMQTSWSIMAGGSSWHLCMV